MKVACGENHKLVNGDLHAKLGARWHTWISDFLVKRIVCLLQNHTSSEEACDEGGMWGKSQVGKWRLACQFACTVSYMDWDADDALFNSYFLVKRILCY